MAVKIVTKTFSTSNPIELDDTTAGADSLYNKLVEIGPANFIDSSYAVMEKGNVTATVVYSEMTGSQNLRCKEICDRRSRGGDTAYTFTGWTGQSGEPTASSSSNEFISAVNSWLDDNDSGGSTITIKNVHFRIDSTGQKRLFIIYDTADDSSATYYAKLYSTNRRSLSSNLGTLVDDYEYIYGYGYGYGSGANYFDVTTSLLNETVDGTTVGYGVAAFETTNANAYGYGYGWEQVEISKPSDEFETDIDALQDSKTVAAAFINQEYDPSGRKHILVIYRAT